MVDRKKQESAGSSGVKDAAPGVRSSADRAQVEGEKGAGGSAPAGGAGSLLPAVTLPTGGGAIRGIGEKFEVNAVTGTAALGIPLPTSPGRSGQSPQVSLSYSSGAGNGPFGLGFQLSVPTITRKTDKGLPRYLDDAETDTYVLSGAEDLVPVLNAQGQHAPRDRTTHLAFPYRPRIEGLFARIERWVDKTTKDVHWRVTTPDNHTNIYGTGGASRIADPAQPAHIFTWFLSETRDDKGNVTVYEYKAEDGAGVDFTKPSERSRFDYGTAAPTFRATAQRYLKRVRYGNAAPGVANDFLFELVFDYGEHAPATTTSVPTPAEAQAWSVRQDAFSSYRSGFEVRTYRLCRRVLMFHRTNPARDALFVRATELEYEPNPAFTYLTGVVQAGYKLDQASSTWQRGEMPRLSLAYQRPELHDELKALPESSLAGLAGGADGSRKQWLDLNGEGIPGLLIDQDGCWFYKENRGGGELSAPQRLSSQPYPAMLVAGMQTLEDLDGDGRLELVSREPFLSGYFARTDDGHFESLRGFESMPHIDWKDPNLRIIDLDGDGHGDILVTEDQAFVWYRSRAKSGFESARRVAVPFDENEGPKVVFADAQQSIQLADMSGDGLVDIVRIRNGAVCYWPNLGYGRFGAKVTLENSPIFAPADEFHASRVRLSDVDGSGTTDIVYLSSRGASLYFNESGNRLSVGTTIHALPPTDSLTHVSVVDLLGTGTSCLVWSTPLGNPSQNVFYVDLLGSKKPHLLVEVNNNLGATTRTTYASSTKFYLEDKLAGNVWLTRLPFPVQVVERTERTDAISGGKLVSRYRYRHGFFDGFEREFRGFARVDQFDTEDFAEPGADPLLFQAPVHSVSWFHTGAWLEKESLELALQKEYFQLGPPLLLVKDTFLPSGLSVQDEREAARALKGSPLRHEVYADDASPKADQPYAITEQNQEVRLIQKSRGENRYGVFFAHPRETVTVTSERNLADPRVGHEIILDVDDFGAVTRRVSIVYGRASGESEQQKSYVTLSEADFVHQANADDVYRIGTEVESRGYEVTGLSLNAAGQALATVDGIRTTLDALDPAQDLDFDQPATTGKQRRLIHRQQRTFYTDDATNEAAFGSVGLRALPYRTYQLALTAGNVAMLVADSQLLSGTAFDPTLLVTEGKYQARSGQYWSVSGRAIFSPSEFYLPTSAVDPFGGTSSVTWDTFKLLLTSTTDPLGNFTSSENDYRVLAPAQITDPNLNRAAVAFDALGMVVATALMGKAGAVPAEGDTLADPTTRIEYDLLRWQTQQKPVFVHSFAREKHGAANPRFQEAFSYSDGFGRIAMLKVQAEPGEVPGVGVVAQRWVGTGRTIFNNKGKPVKQYEPFFSATSDFETEAAIVQTGVTPIIHYDPLDRVIRIELPDGSENRVEIDSWLQKTFDPNDAVVGTRWLTEHQAGTADEQRAAALALKHADTPTVTHFDSLGRAFLVQTDNGPDPAGPTGPHRLQDTRTTLDIQGNVLAIKDPLGIVTMQQRFDVLQRHLRTDSPDAGARLAVADVAGKPLRGWDSRNQTMRSLYDALQRPTHMYVKQGTTERLLLRTVYGEALDPLGVPNGISVAQGKNLRSRIYLSFDCAGLLVSENFDFKGNLLSKSRRLARDYTTEPNWASVETLPDPSALPPGAIALLETEQFINSATYDALNRIVTHTAPDLSVTVPTYNEANRLERLDVSVAGGGLDPVIENLDYNAKGQRVQCRYANGTVTSYVYDPKTFRLNQLTTLRGLTKLQDLVYTFDPIGNIVAVRNNADTDPIFSGATVVDGHGLYEYDPRYRLISATGREHPGTQPVDIETSGGSALPYNIPSPNDLAALRNYTEKYSYDDADNITQVKHLAGPSNSAGWTRNYAYSPVGQVQTSNRLLRTSVPGAENDISLAYTYDPHGSMSSMPNLQVMDWDYADRLKHTRPLASASDQDTHYTYDATGQRVRKVHVASGAIKERIYLGDYEIYRERPAASGSAVTLERQTLHLMDEARRVALVERKTRDAGVSVANPPLLWRFQLDNHLGSSMLELDETGAIITYEESHPYGSTAFQTTNGNAEVSAKRYRYTGKERDAETGLYYYGARYYAPWLGRWTAADPAGTVDGLNLYQYAKNEPTNLVDETGQQAGPYQPYIDINRFTAKLNQAVSAVTNSAPVQFALGVGDAAADTVTGAAASVRDRLVRTGTELEAHPIAYGAAGPLAVPIATSVSEVKHQVAEVKAKAADQGGGVRGWFVAVNQQWNPAFGIFEHGDKAIDAAKSGEWRAAGAETTHTGTSVLATVGLAEGGAALAEGALRKVRAPTPKPHAPHHSAPAPKPHVPEPIVPEPSVPEATAAPPPAATPAAPPPPAQAPAAPSTTTSPATTAPAGTNRTRLGVKRTNPADWRQLRDTWDQTGLGDILSAENRSAIARGRTPVVDQAWVRHFPGDAALIGEKIPMHHIGGTPITVPLPASRHLDAHMPGGFRRNPGGPGRSG